MLERKILLLLTVSLLMASFVRSVLAALNRTATSPADKVSVEPRLSNRVSVRSPPCKGIQTLNLRHMYTYVHTYIHTYIRTLLTYVPLFTGVT